MHIDDKIRQMAAKNHVKNIARQLYQEGHETAFIAQRCDVSHRTAQRWVKSFEQETVRVTSEAEAPVTEVLPALDRIANTPTDSVSVSIIPSTAVRLLNLADASIAAVESVLRNPDSSDANKIRAAALASKWVGLEGTSNGKKPCPSVLSTISKRSGVTINVESSESSELQLTPLVIKDKRDQEYIKGMREAEAEKKRQEENRKLEEEKEMKKREKISDAMQSMVHELLQMEEPYPYEKIIQHPLFDFGIFIECLDNSMKSDVFCKILEDMVEVLEYPTEVFDSLKVVYAYHFPEEPYLREEWEYGDCK